jgi:hypothetical protein
MNVNEIATHAVTIPGGDTHGLCTAKHTDLLRKAPQFSATRHRMTQRAFVGAGL